MIYLGYENIAKNEIILRYCKDNQIKKVFILSPKKFDFRCGFDEKEFIDWPEIIKYKFYYRLLQEIDKSTLVVVNECLRTQNRYDLTYNCIRNFLNQTKHQIIFQYLPFIDNIQDFMILFDFDTRSRWKRENFDKGLLKESEIRFINPDIQFEKIPIHCTNKTKTAYDKEKKKLFDNLGNKDPHTLPRQLHLVAGKEKLGKVDENKGYVGRNNRFKFANMQTYQEDSFKKESYIVFEWPHNFINFIDFLSLSKQVKIPVMVADLKVDEWYFTRYSEWLNNLNDAYTKLLR